MVQGKMYHLTAWPTYKKTPPMFCHKMFRLQLRPAEGKQGKKYLPLLKFTSRCCLFTKFWSRHQIWTLFAGIVSKPSSTLPLEMLSTMKYFTVRILWSDLVTTTIHWGELVNCKSLPVSLMGRPPGEACFLRLKRNDQVEPIFSTTATSSPESTRIWYSHLEPS